MVRTVTDLLTTVFLIAFAAFLVKNAKGGAQLANAGTNFVTKTIQAFTFQTAK